MSADRFDQAVMAAIQQHEWVWPGILERDQRRKCWNCGVRYDYHQLLQARTCSVVEGRKAAATAFARGCSGGPTP